MHGRSTTIQKRYPDPGSDASSVWNFCALFSGVIWGEASDSVAKCRLFSQATRSKASFESQIKTLWVARRYTSNSIPEDPKFDHLPWEAVHAPRPPGCSPKIPEISVRNQMEQSISIRSDRNIWDHPSRWSTLTGQVTSVGRTEMSLSIWQNCCPQYRSFVSCLQKKRKKRKEKKNNQTRGGLGRVCVTGMYRCIGHVDFPKFQIGVFVKWKAPPICPKWTVKFFHSTRTTNMIWFWSPIYIIERRIYL